MTFLDLLPAYRMDVEGEDSLSNNQLEFAEAGERLLAGKKVAIFPETYAQQKHRIATFSQGYLRMIFNTAEKANFETDIYVVPAAIHYSNMFTMQSDMMVKFTQPISLKPYYELYKTKPRTVWREVNAIASAQVKEAMLNIENDEFYDSIDYLRETYGVRYAMQNGVDSNHLPSRLETDKELCAKLDALAENNKEEVEEIFADTLQLKDFTYANKLRDKIFENEQTTCKSILYALVFIALFPLYLLALWPNIIVFYAPKPIVDKLMKKDRYNKLFIGGVRYTISALVSVPLSIILILLGSWLLFGPLVAIIHVLLWPVLGLFAWYYRKSFIHFKTNIKFNNKIKKDDNYKKWSDRRAEMFSKLDSLLK